MSLRGAWEILRRIPHLSNVTYLLAKEGLDVVSMHDIVVYICSYDVSMKFIHAIVGGLSGRIFETIVACIVISLVI